MAIDYGNYAQIYGRGTDLSGFSDAIGRAVEGSNQMRAMNIAKISNDWQESISVPFSKAAFGEIGQYRNYFSTPMSNAGTALKNFKDYAAAKLGNGDIDKGMKTRAYLEMSAQGRFNPIAFKQEYDQLVSQYTPTIERKLETFKDEKGLSDRDFQRWMNKPEFTHLRNFIQDYGSDTGPSYAASKTYQPLGLIPGAFAEVTENPWRYAMPLGGASAAFGAMKGAWGAAPGYGSRGSAALKGAGAGLRGTYVPSYLKAGEFGKGKTPSLKSIANQLDKGVKGKPLYREHWKSKGQALKKRYGQKLSGATRSRNTAFKKATGKTWNQSAKGIAKAAQTRWAKGKGLSYAQKVSSFAGKQSAVTKKVAQGSLQGIQAILKKHGKAKVISALGKHLGWGQAVKIAGKLALGTALTGTGLGTIAGIAMNAWTLYEIGNILNEALGETELGRPDKMLFGGR